MALIKCFTDSHIENMAACLQLCPRELILIGNTERMEQHANRYRQVLQRRNQHTEIMLCNIQARNLMGIYAAVKDILCRDANCIIDLTGGDELVVMAVGAVMAGLDAAQREHLQVVRYDFSKNCLVDCIHDHAPLPGCNSGLTVEDLIFLQGGIIHPASQQPLQGFSSHQLDPLWDMVSTAPKKWNRAISVLVEFESRADSRSQVFLPLSFLRGSIHNFEEKESLIRSLLDEFHQRGIIDNRSNAFSLEYTYTSDLYRYCTQKAGNALEVKTLLEARSLYEDGAPYFRDCQMGVNLDWDGVVHDPILRIPETRNEIDVVLTRGLNALFISCKNGAVGEEELYKLHTVATYFGGRHAKKMLIATDLDQKSAAANRALIQRAWDMDILLVTDAAELAKAEWKQIFLNAMA